MIVAKPNPQMLFSFGFFALASAAIIYWNASIYFFSSNPRWYNFGILLLLAPILGYVLYRLLFQLKRIELGNNTFVVHYLFYNKKKSYTVAEIESWKEHKVKVGKNSTYRELEIIFKSTKKISLGKKEYTEYDKVLGYLKRKVGRKEIIS